MPSRYDKERTIEHSLRWVDSLYVDVDRNNAPDVAIGRLLVWSSTESANRVEKTTK